MDLVFLRGDLVFVITDLVFAMMYSVAGMLGFWIHGVVGVMAPLHYSGSTDGCDYLLCICNIDLVLEIIHSLNVYLVFDIMRGGGLLLGCCCWSAAAVIPSLLCWWSLCCQPKRVFLDTNSCTYANTTQTIKAILQNPDKLQFANMYQIFGWHTNVYLEIEKCI